MAKVSGLGARLLVHGYDFSGDISAVDNIHGGPAALDFTGIDKSAFERLGGVRDGGIDVTAFFNKGSSADRAHDRYSTLPTTDVITTYCHTSTLGAPAACLVGKQTNYDGKRGNDGSFTFSVSAVANGFGLEWGVQGTAGVRADTTATNGSSIDLGTGSLAFGLQAYLHVTAFTGTSCTVKLQESSDDGAGDAFADVTGGSFGAQTAVGASRIATSASQTVERYLRVVTTGTFSACSFHVTIVRNATATVF